MALVPEASGPTPVSDGHGRHHAFPGFVIAADGGYLAAYRDADDHYVCASASARSDRGVIALRRSDDAGRTWGAPVVIQDDGQHDSRDPALALLADGSVVMSYFVYAGEVVSSYVRRSRDHGLSWDAPVAVAHPFETGSAVCGPVVEFGAGTLLLPLFGRFAGEADISSVVVRSDDGGASWSPLATVATGGGLQWTEPNLVVRSDGSLLCLIRQNAAPRAIHACVSDDGGETWSTPVSVIEGNGRPACIVLPEGDVLTIYRAPGGATSFRTSPDGVGGWREAGVLDAEPMSTYAQMVLEQGGSVAVVYALEQDRYRSAVRFHRLVSAA